MSLRTKVAYGIFLSLLAHLLFFNLIPTGRPVSRDVFAVEIFDAKTNAPLKPQQPKSSNIQSDTSNRKSSRQSGAVEKRTSKEQMTGLLHPGFAPRAQVENADSSNVTSDFSASENFMFNSKTYDEANAIHGFLDALYAEINGFLIFDSILAQYNHFGTVFVQFRVNPKGRIIEDSIRVKSDDKILQVHVLRTALIPGLSRDLKKNLWVPNETTIICKFEFKHKTDYLSVEGIVGKSLTFIRTTIERRVSRSVGKQLINGGIQYDLFAMYETWEKFREARLREKLDVDPFSIYRADKFYNY